MTTAQTQQMVPAEFAGFFDDAATFPPGLAPLDRAIRDHVTRWSNPLCGAVGPAVLNLKDLPEARRVASGLEREGRVVEVSAVVPAGQVKEALEAIPACRPELEVVALELKTDPDIREVWTSQIREAATVAGPEVFMELTADQIFGGALELLAGTNLHLKYRTGGIKAHLFPSPEQLAAVIVAAASADIQFKLTAGLHEAIRHMNPATGFTHHGFLNIALATAAARDGQPADAVEKILTEIDASLLAKLAEQTDGSWRASFRSFGTCSVGEPADSLTQLGLFPPGLA